jgi:hypothetical protein
MSGDTAAPEGAAVLLTFEVWWRDGDQPVTMFDNIIGSNLEDNILYLSKVDPRVEYIINLDEVRYVRMSDR